MKNVDHLAFTSVDPERHFINVSVGKSLTTIVNGNYICNKKSEL